MAPLLNQRYHVIMENWFSSPDMFHKLYSKQRDTMGTLCHNRKGVPAEIKSAKIEKGTTCFSLQRQANDNEVEKQKRYVL
jgi:hypothetical protein